MSFALTSVRPRAALASVSASCQCRYASSRSITVKLVRTVEGLGRGNELVQVNPGRMRHDLFPEGKAVYVPWKRRSQLNGLIANKTSASSSTSQDPVPVASTTPLLSASEFTNLSSLLPLSITLPVPASTSTNTLFGSLHPSDLARYHQLSGTISEEALNKVDFNWAEKEHKDGRVEAGEKVRKVGRYVYEVKVRGDRSGSMRVEREVEIVPQETN